MNLQERVLNIDNLTDNELIELLIEVRQLCGYSSREFGEKANLSHSIVLQVENGGKMSFKTKKKIKDGIIVCMTIRDSSNQTILIREMLLNTEKIIDAELKEITERIKYKKSLIKRSNDLLEDIRDSLLLESK